MDAQLDPLSGDYTGQRIGHLGNAVYLRLQTLAVPGGLIHL